MAECSVCGRPGEPVTSAQGLVMGAACSPECATLVYVQPIDTTTDEKTLTAWVWRARRAAVRGLGFIEPPPLSVGERKAIFEQRRLMQSTQSQGVAQWR